VSYEPYKFGAQNGVVRVQKVAPPSILQTAINIKLSTCISYMALGQPWLWLSDSPGLEVCRLMGGHFPFGLWALFFTLYFFLHSA
jgi:hypothetical protein